jgi:NADPH-dependent ferric siderophore reductase
MRRPVPDDLFGGRLAGSFLLDLEVGAVHQRSPRYRTITFRSPDLLEFEWRAGQDLMFDVPGTDPVLRRRYSIRRADPAAGTLDVDVVLHERGRFAAWAATASPGERIDAIGPRGAIGVRDGSGHHLFVGDESSIAATFAMVESLPAGAAATVVLACEGEPPVAPPEAAAPVDLRWTTEVEVAGALRSLDLPDGTAAYCNGERSLVRVAAGVLAERGLPADAVSTKAYWRRDQANAPHGEPAKDS